MRRALLGAAACLVLAGCGGADGSTATGASGSASPGLSAPAASTPSAAAPAAQKCPITPTKVPPPKGAVTDLAKKPTVAGSKQAPPRVVQVADLVVGTGAEATTLSSVEVKYVGALYTTGKEFDSSWKTGADKTFAFHACATETVPGFSVAPLGMKVGGRRQVTIPSELGYAAKGSPPTIPPNAALVFVIDLVKVTPPGA